MKKEFRLLLPPSWFLAQPTCLSLAGPLPITRVGRGWRIGPALPHPSLHAGPATPSGCFSAPTALLFFWFFRSGPSGGPSRSPAWTPLPPFSPLLLTACPYPPVIFSSSSTPRTLPPPPCPTPCHPRCPIALLSKSPPPYINRMAMPVPPQSKL